jgi:hypothetical protein
VFLSDLQYPILDPNLNPKYLALYLGEWARNAMCVQLALSSFFWWGYKRRDELRRPNGLLNGRHPLGRFFHSISCFAAVTFLTHFPRCVSNDRRMAARVTVLLCMALIATSSRSSLRLLAQRNRLRNTHKLTSAVFAMSSSSSSFPPSSSSSSSSTSSSAPSSSSYGTPLSSEVVSSIFAPSEGTGQRNILSLFVAGGGVQAVPWLLSVPGSSSTVMNAAVPYSEAALKELTKGAAALIDTANAAGAGAGGDAAKAKPGACSAETAVLMVSWLYSNNTLRFCAAKHQRGLHHSKAQHSRAQDSTAQHSTAQHSTAQHRIAQHSTAQHSRAQESTA